MDDGQNQISTNQNNIYKLLTSAGSYNNHVSVLKPKLIVVIQKWLLNQIGKGWGDVEEEVCDVIHIHG